MDEKEILLSTRIYEQVKDNKDPIDELQMCFKAANEFAATSKNWRDFEVTDADFL